MVRTDHILFMAAGAFHVSKPSDLIPELQGRFPIRVELESLTIDDFKRILVEPKNSLVKQYRALMETEGVKLDFGKDAIDAIANFAARVNQQTEDIGARRLHTIMERLLDEISFEGPDLEPKDKLIDAAYVEKMLADTVKDQDLSRYILWSRSTFDPNVRAFISIKQNNEEMLDSSVDTDLRCVVSYTGTYLRQAPASLAADREDSSANRAAHGLSTRQSSDPELAQAATQRRRRQRPKHSARRCFSGRGKN